jgi:hypothetical protein
MDRLSPKSARLLIAVIAALAIAASLTVGEAGAKARICTPVTVRVQGNDFTYPVKVLKGKVSCKVARSTLKHFIGKSSSPHGWACFRGHGADKWAAKCASTGKSHKTIQASNPIAG